MGFTDMGPVSVIPWVWRRGFVQGRADSHWGCPTHTVFPLEARLRWSALYPKFWEVTRSKASGDAKRLGPTGTIDWDFWARNSL